ncbi:MAG: ubiquinone biosynthesis protein [Proteobacteria bacterium SG_bin7]|nr:MAG: ubiquinone biosynthesis protein [Proteobacteria bacterium SG_bin7]
MAFEELGPTFVKLGQVLASRPDLIPNEFIEEFKKLHNQVKTISWPEIESAVKEYYSRDLSDVFSEFDKEPLAAASIAQVHKAILRDGEKVVVKVRRPGIIETINEDLAVLFQLAELLQTYVPEARIYNPIAVVDEFFKTMQLETNFIVEANNMRRFAMNFANDDTIRIPKVFWKYTGESVLVMEALEGVPLSFPSAVRQDGLDLNLIVNRGLKVFMKMVFTDGFFHGDLHPGNLFIMPGNVIGLVDFGVVGRLNRRTQDAIASMLVGLATEDYERLAHEYVDLAPYSEGIDVNLLAREIRDLISPYYGLTMKDVNMAKVMFESTSIAARHQLHLPRELMLFFKSLMGMESLGKLLVMDFDFLSYSLEVAKELVKNRYEPKRIATEITSVIRESQGLIYEMPRQVRNFFRKVNNPNFAIQIHVPQMEDTKRAIETSSNILFLAIIIGSLIISSSILVAVTGTESGSGMPMLAVLGYVSAMILAALGFYKSA